MTNNIIKLILSGALMYSATAQCASAEQMQDMAANEARSMAFLEETHAIFTDLRQKAYQQHNLIINITASQRQADDAAGQAANAEYIRANDVVKQAILEELKNMALMLLETAHQGKFQLAVLEEKIHLLQAAGIHPGIFAELTKMHADAKRELAAGQEFAKRTLARQAQEAVDIAALQAGARQALEAAQQIPNQQIAAMRREVEIHQAAADAPEVADAVDQVPVVARGAADRLQDIMQAANMEIRFADGMRMNDEAINAARNGDVDKVAKILENDQQFLAKTQNDAIFPAELMQEVIDTLKYGKIALLFLACEHQQINMIHLLLHAGADIDGFSRLSGSTCLMTAAQAGHANVVELLIQAGADKTKRNDDRRTALMIAAHGGHDRIVGMLLQAGADIETRDNNGQTPLILAAQLNHPETVEILLNEGAERQAIDNNGLTALHYAQKHGNWRMLNLFTRN